MRKGHVFASAPALFRWCLFSFCISAAAIGSAQERFRWAQRRSVDGEDWRFDREDRSAGRWRLDDQVEGNAFETGYVFVEGKYIQPPYVVRLAEGNLLINDQVVEQTADVNENKGPSHWGHVRVRRSFRRVRSGLESGGIVATFSGQPLVVISHCPTKELLLEALATAPAERRPLGSGVQGSCGNRQDTLSTWVSRYKPPRDLLERIHLELDELKRVESANMAAISATHRLYNFAYPLSALGMLGVALAIGHLLLERPGGDVSSHINPSPEARRLVVRSILFVIAFSALDLVWTILASQANAMSELNLLGGRLIRNPLALTAFKASATAVTVGILLVFWQHRRAQFASWWACLICTLLTIRWLTFHSLFVT